MTRNVFMAIGARLRFGLIVRHTDAKGQLHDDVTSIQLSGARLLRSQRTKELFVARKSALKEFSNAARLVHENLSTIQCIFNSEGQITIVYEYSELCFFDFPYVTPLTEMEIAIAMSQFTSAIKYLTFTLPSFPIHNARLSLYGKVKLLLDFGFYSQSSRKTTYEYWEELYKSVMLMFKEPHVASCQLNCTACYFFKESAKDILSSDNKFLKLGSSSRPRGLTLAAKKAAGILLAIQRPTGFNYSI